MMLLYCFNCLNVEHIGRGSELSQWKMVRPAARLCVINGLSKLKHVVGNLDNIKKFVKVSGYVNCDPSFTDHAKVINGASDFLVEVFGGKRKKENTPECQLEQVAWLLIAQF